MRAEMGQSLVTLCTYNCLCVCVCVCVFVCDTNAIFNFIGNVNLNKNSGWVNDKNWDGFSLSAASQMSIHNKLNHLNIKDKPMDCNKNKNKIEKEENKIWIPLQKQQQQQKTTTQKYENITMVIIKNLYKMTFQISNYTISLLIKFFPYGAMLILM